MAVKTAQQSPMKLRTIARYSDLGVAAAAVIVIGMMIVPLPDWLLDVLLTLNLTVALTILLVTVYTTEALQFASFPGMLLVTTLFRLGLNISATRLILLNGAAGSVISAFGSVVIGGNYVVGVVVFIILIIVQFVVITNGTGRVAEVAARFTLDAMPGKQMAIDADLNAGTIDEDEAHKRRRDISREADFYGAMDGASKFVRGDAVAAVVMIIVNILGGFLVGVGQRHMDFMSAVQTYTLLTVGMGLVTQIPALLISTAAGLMVTKAASESNLGSEMTAQVLAQPKALGITAAVCGVLALIPGMPKVPFLLAAVCGGGLVYMLKQQTVKRVHEGQAKAQPTKTPESMADLLTIDPIEVELGYGLIPLADAKQGGDLLERITAARKHAALDLGLLVPPIRIRDNMQLKPNTYCVKLRGVEIASGEVYPGQLLAMNSNGVAAPLQGIETVEPTFGLPATWISDVQQSEAELVGYTVVDPLSVMITHLTEILRRNAAEVLTRQDTQTLIDSVKANSPAVVDELIPNLLTVGDVQKVLQNLLAERVSIRDLTTILETLADAARVVKDPDLLTGYARQALARQLTKEYQSEDGIVRAFTLDPSLEQMMADNLLQTDSGQHLVLDPDSAQRILEATRAQVERVAAMGYQPVALCSPRVRIHYRRLIERMTPMVAVLSYNELSSGAKLQTMGMVNVSDEDRADQIPQFA